ncbi:histidine-containing phosphotransfer protein 2 [Citrus sinensis]|uniref:Histidine-containing phosphotransfer protein 2 n=1 Tax=Citrus sinensis TaxID=2711 RepID=A0ACB8MVZ2_CITSI|nr:histidine-containing phosphotransfer protein 2 [Citrus sinensis]KAH9789545.1 histidine-containing phosphotransfer protein 2 [Citrus sinensis]
MESNPLHQQIASMRQHLLDEEILDEQFVELEGLALASDEDPNFVEVTINVYFEESNELLPMIEDLLGKNPIEGSEMERILHRFKGSCASAKAAFEQVKTEQGNLKAKLDSYFELVKQAKA